VIKELRGVQRREACIYEEWWSGMDRPPAPRVLGVESLGEAQFLYLEEVRPSSRWPWRDSASTAAVCREIARLHDDSTLAASAFAWDYEAYLAASAQDTLATALSARTAAGVRHWPRIGDLRRVVGALPRLRDRLLRADATVIHGDLHAGNVMIRAGSGEPRIALIDWARARIGSPLEDIASWLHSLGCWEPEARRRHDTLLRVYLESRRTPMAVTADLRARYWIASASNGLSGAIRYHLAVLSDPRATGRRRDGSRLALRAWARVIRRVASLLTTRHDR
jgi:hypothetical protein